MTGCRLVPVDLREDLPCLYAMMTGEDQYLFSTKLCFHSMDSFGHWLQDHLGNHFHDFYMVRLASAGDMSETTIGYVHNYDFSLIDGHCKLSVYIQPAYRQTGLGGIAAALFMQRLFAEYPLRKLYSAIYEYNAESLRSNLAAGFQEEGVLRDYRYYNGAYHDLYYLSITREQFQSRLEKLVTV